MSPESGLAVALAPTYSHRRLQKPHFIGRVLLYLGVLI